VWKKHADYSTDILNPVAQTAQKGAKGLLSRRLFDIGLMQTGGALSRKSSSPPVDQANRERVS
jgi:hypothetical protein